jgi:hypothetical protein
VVQWAIILADQWQFEGRGEGFDVKQIIVAAGIAALGFATMDAVAAGCEDYADRAVRQFKASQILACGFSGPRWMENLDAHAGWCEEMSFATVESEDSARQESLVSCVSGRYKAAVVSCHMYAQRAVEQNRVNEQMACGFTGPRWQNNYDAHYAWCTQRNEGALRFEDEGRRLQIKQCIGRD